MAMTLALADVMISAINSTVLQASMVNSIVMVFPPFFISAAYAGRPTECLFLVHP